MINNYSEFKQFISNLTSKPKLLLHACCAPCSSHTLFLLAPYFSITIFYSNDNIFPKEEFEKRIEEIKNFVNNAKLDVKIIADDYDYNRFLNAVKGLESLGERSKRCYSCYTLRLERAALYAKENNFDYFTTTLSISPYKVTSWINEIGYNLEKKYNIKYLFSDFKKEDGYKDSIKLSQEYNLYRQDYCGCAFSKHEKEEKTK